MKIPESVIEAERFWVILSKLWDAAALVPEKTAVTLKFSGYSTNIDGEHVDLVTKTVETEILRNLQQQGVITNLNFFEEQNTYAFLPSVIKLKQCLREMKNIRENKEKYFPKSRIENLTNRDIDKILVAGKKAEEALDNINLAGKVRFRLWEPGGSGPLYDKDFVAAGLKLLKLWKAMKGCRTIGKDFEPDQKVEVEINRKEFFRIRDFFKKEREKRISKTQAAVETTEKGVLRWDGLSFDPNTGNAAYGKVKSNFRVGSYTYKILKALMEKQGERLSHDDIANILYQSKMSKRDPRLFSYHIREIRKKLGMGYVDPEFKTRRRKGPNKNLIAACNGYRLIMPE